MRTTSSSRFIGVRPWPRAAAALSLAVASAVVGACGGGEGGGGGVVAPPPPPPPPSLTVAPATAALEVHPGESATTALTLTRGGGYTGAVALAAAVAGSPAGVSAAFEPANAPAGTNQSTVTFATTAVTPVGEHAVTITGAGAGVNGSATLVLRVTPAPAISLGVGSAAATVARGAGTAIPVVVTRAGSYAGEVTLAAEGLPAGVTAAFAPAALSGGATASTLTLAASDQAAAGGPVQVVLRARGPGVPDATFTLPLTVARAAALGLTGGATALSVTRGGAAEALPLTLARPAGFTGPVTLAAQAPAGVTAELAPATLPAGQTAATLSVRAGAAGPASGQIVVTAAGAGVEAATLTVPYAVAEAAGVALSVAPSPVAVTAGGAAAAATVTLARTNFAGGVTLVASGAPAGLTVALPDGPVAGATAAVTVRAAEALAAGDYPLTITGTAAGLAPATAGVVVRVAPAPAPEAGVVTGVALDARGRPLAGVKVFAKMMFNPNVVTARTGADGRYTVRGLPTTLASQIRAWYEFDYRGRTYCSRLAMPALPDYDPFVPSTTVTRDFRWQLTGRVPDAGSNYFGAKLALAMTGADYAADLLEDGDDVEVRLTPQGPLVDGTEAPVFARTVRFARTGWESAFVDIPHGVYAAEVTRVRGGVRTRLQVGAYPSGPLGATATVDWLPANSGGSCGSVLNADLATYSLRISFPE